MTRDEFVEMLTDLSAASKTCTLVAYRREEDIPDGPLDDGEYDEDMDNWGSLLVRAFGRLAVDDHDEESWLEDSDCGRRRCTSMWWLEDIHTWPPGLFEKLVSYTWVVAFGDRLDILKVLSGIKK